MVSSAVQRAGLETRGDRWSNSTKLCSNAAWRQFSLTATATFSQRHPNWKSSRRTGLNLVLNSRKSTLSTYEGYSQVFCFAPKLTKLNVRKVGLLHPFDLIFYTSIVSERCAMEFRLRDFPPTGSFLTEPKEPLEADYMPKLLHGMSSGQPFKPESRTILVLSWGSRYR